VFATMGIRVHDTRLKALMQENTLQHTATHCNTLQHTATHCNTLQHTATHCDLGLQEIAAMGISVHDTRLKALT